MLPLTRLVRFLFIKILLVWFFASGPGRAWAQQRPEFIRLDTTITVTAGKHYQKSKFHQFWFGKHYRPVWAEPVEVPLFRNPEGRKNLTPLKMGGSYQTKNLRLADSKDREYVLRSIDKDPTGALPEWLQKSFVARLMQDQTTVIHPYGAFIVPTLASAAGIYHTNPQLVYITSGTDLGEFSEEFKNMLVLLEERPDDNRQDVDSFGNSKKIKSSAKAFEDLYRSNCHQLDARFYLRSRLFDMLIGDWSRREDQWRWATFQQDSITLYKAIPRDRDHAFFLFNDGVITRLISWFKPTYQTFSEDFNNIEGLNQTARPTDDYFLAMLTEADFVAEADHLKNSLTDEVIQKAVSVWPQNIQQISAETFTRKLTNRRNQLPEVARQYYRLLNQEVTLPGTDDPEHFMVENLPDGSVKITQQKFSDYCPGQTKTLVKTFHPAQTKQISIYGLAGNDRYTVAGSGKKKIQLLLYPGDGMDSVSVQTAAKGGRRQIIVFTEPDGTALALKTKAFVQTKKELVKKDTNSKKWLKRHRLD